MKFQRTVGNVITTHWQKNVEGEEGRTRFGVSFALATDFAPWEEQPVFGPEHVEDLFAAVQAASDWLEFVSDPEDLRPHHVNDDPEEDGEPF